MTNINNRGKKVLVTDSGRGSSIAIIRSLGRAGYNVVAADATDRSIGFRSRYAHETLVYPSPMNDRSAFIEVLLDAVKAKGIDLIIPVTDPVIQSILASRKILEEQTRLALPDESSLAVVNDKQKTVELARGLGVSVPGTYMARSVEEALAISEKMSWPIVLKPTLSAKLLNGKNVETFNVSYANSADELRALMSGYEGRCTVLMQEYFHGTGYGVELLMYQGQEIAAFAHKRIREIPITGGASAYRESAGLDDLLYQQSLNMLQELQWTGLAMVEFKVRKEEARLMEINGRIWGSLPLAVASGVNFPLLLAGLYLDGFDSVRQHTSDDYKTGIFCRDLQRDLMWIVSVLGQRKKYPFLKVPRRIEAAKALVGLFNPMTKSDLFSLDDPLPAIAELPQIVQKFGEKVRR